MRKRRKFYGLILVLFVVIGFFVFKSNFFEKKHPQILSQDLIYNNLENPISLDIKDENSGIKNVKIILKKDSNDSGLILLDEKIKDKKDLTLQVKLPKSAYKEKIKSYILEVEVGDRSFWNFFGNKIQKQILVVVDKTSPKIDILSHSYQIEKGGAARVVFSSSDENLDEV